MKKSFLLLIPVIIIFLQNCSEPVSYVTVMGEAQGTTYNIIYQHPEEKVLKTEIDSILNDFDMTLSTWKPESIISRINNNDNSVVLNEMFIEVFNKSMEIAEASDGMFDITIGPILNAFGFGSTERTNVDSLLVDSLLEFVGYKKIRIEGDKIVKDNPNVYIDCSAIAQGYSVDIVSDYLDSQGCKNYLVEIGGEVKSKGKNPSNEPWNVGVDKPSEDNNMLDREIQAIIKLSDKALATSGNYRKYFEENGVKFSHTFNPKTGYPIRSKLLSATILANDCMTADGYATACMVIGLEKSKELIESKPDMEAYFIYSNEDGSYGEYFTDGLKELIIEIK